MQTALHRAGLALVAVALSAAPLLARPELRQHGRGDGTGEARGDDLERAYDRGHERGENVGRQLGARDGSHGRPFDLEGARDERNMDEGWRRWMGPRRAYVRGFRLGFAEGYRAAYREIRRGQRDGDDRRGTRSFERREPSRAGRRGR